MLLPDAMNRVLTDFLGPASGRVLQCVEHLAGRLNFWMPSLPPVMSSHQVGCNRVEPGGELCLVPKLGPVRIDLHKRLLCHVVRFCLVC